MDEQICGGTSNCNRLPRGSCNIRGVYETVFSFRRRAVCSNAAILCPFRGNSRGPVRASTHIPETSEDLLALNTSLPCAWVTTCFDEGRATIDGGVRRQQRTHNEIIYASVTRAHPGSEPHTTPPGGAADRGQTQRTLYRWGVGRSRTKAKLVASESRGGATLYPSSSVARRHMIPTASASVGMGYELASSSPIVKGHHDLMVSQGSSHQPQQCERAPLADAGISSVSTSSSDEATTIVGGFARPEERRMLRIHPQTRRSFSCPSRKSARLTRDNPVGRLPTTTSISNVSLVLECAIENLGRVVAEFQQGVAEVRFKDGDLAARNGHIYIARHIAATFTEQAMVLAAAHGHLEMVAYLHNCRSEGTTVEAMDLAARYGHLEVVQWLHVHRSEGCTTRAMDGAACNAHIEVLKFLKMYRAEGATTAAIDSAAANGHLYIIQWLTTNLPALAATTRAMDSAARAGHFDVVRFLHEARGEGCTVDAMDSAASRGHLEIVKFLHHSRPEGCTTAAMDNAASGGHMGVLEFLAENRGEGGTPYAMTLAAWRGRLNVVEWLHDNREEGCTSSAMNGAAYNGHLEVVKWLNDNRSEGCTTCAMDVSAMHGRLEVLQWLHAHREEGCTTNAMDWAAKEGRLDVVRWLHDNRTEGCTEEALDWAAGNGHIDVLRFLLRRSWVGHSPRAVEWATRNGHQDIVDLLQESQH